MHLSDYKKCKLIQLILRNSYNICNERNFCGLSEGGESAVDQ